MEISQCDVPCGYPCTHTCLSIVDLPGPLQPGLLPLLQFPHYPRHVTGDRSHNAYDMGQGAAQDSLPPYPGTTPLPQSGPPLLAQTTPAYGPDSTHITAGVDSGGEASVQSCGLVFISNCVSLFT